MLDDIVRYLRCPYCAGGLVRAGAALNCPAGHSFDIARQGYASLLPPGASGGAAGARGAGGDTAAMVQARSDFLAAGHFAGLAVKVAEVAAAAAGVAGGGTADGDMGDGRGGGCVVDCGAGTGYYLARLLDARPGQAGIALERSRYALRRAARAHERAGAVACDVWQGLPVATAAAAVAINVFAPRNGAELHRILRPGGLLLVVTPDQNHLRELTAALGLLAVDERKDERIRRELGPYFGLETSRGYRTTMKLSRADVLAAALMGPSAWHTGASDLAARAAELPEPVPVTLSVTLSAFRRGGAR
ncbi:MAG TPA: 23S rRNA methyltransferase [Streptosporangiaceae bacterium]